MKRVSRRACEEGPLLEEQETEGERRLHGLLLQQLHTDVDIDRCVAKKQCFAPAALYRPFGEQAAGVRSLSQFQVLQEEEQELASLRELGLSDAEIRLWQSRDAAEKSHGVGAAPDAKQQRLQTIREKIEARAELLSRPQRFATSRPLSRREMEIEQALFQGNERPGFLTALYHRDESSLKGQQGASSSDPMDSLYKDVLCSSEANPPPDRYLSPHRTEPQQPNSTDPPEQLGSEQQQEENVGPSVQSEPTSEDRPDPAAPVQIEINQRIGSLRGSADTAASGGPLTVRGQLEIITDEEILENRECEEMIRSIPRFRNYQPGKPSKVLCVKNVSTQASVAQLVALFSRFEKKDAAPILYRLLTGRLKGQAFVTLADLDVFQEKNTNLEKLRLQSSFLHSDKDTETAQHALHLVHGYRLLGKPLVLEFGHERQEEKKQEEENR
ncbi:RNA-binding protein 41 isoform X2 [Oryzias melastigma]|uniref:RNA binding motif protein 41 n=1 Tax=Oryzias melastigma TaxID=30732 RepID=A0A3B3E389_ORYME|nr:RNA-binding protein 41 isoform X2 [Oryzias melastigma]